jgi:magnesium chelatase family protein
MQAFVVDRGKNKLHCNADMQSKRIKQFCPINAAVNGLLKVVASQLGLTAIGYGRVLKLARSVRDLEASEQIQLAHVAEAIEYRAMDGKLRGET